MEQTPKLQHQGRTYSGTYQVRGEDLVVFHHNATKQGSLHGLDPAAFSLQLLFEIVVRDGKGIPDPEQDTPSTDTRS